VLDAAGAVEQEWTVGLPRNSRGSGRPRSVRGGFGAETMVTVGGHAVLHALRTIAASGTVVGMLAAFALVIGVEIFSSVRSSRPGGLRGEPPKRSGRHVER